MHLFLKYRYLTIFCAMSAAVIASLSNGQTAIAANQKVSQQPLNSVLVSDNSDSEKPNSLFKGLPRSVIYALRQDLSQRTGVSPGNIRILSYSRQNWSDACLGLGKANELCAQVITPGWRIRASANSKVWIYHSDERGRNIRLNSQISGEAQLPDVIGDAVLKDIEDRFQVSSDRLKITYAERRTWSDGCLGLPKPGEICTEALVAGWRVTVVGNDRKWIYRTNSTGSIVRYDREASNNIPDDKVELPKRVVDAVLDNAKSVLGISVDRLKITKAEEKVWNGGCLGLPKPGEGCTKNLVPGWEVTVRHGDQRLVYRTNRRGSEVRLDREASDFDKKNSQLPTPVAGGVLRETQRRSGLSRSELKIVSAERKTWSDSCFGLGGAAEICATGRFPGWRVVVEGGKRRWVYHTDNSGSRIILNPESSDDGDRGSITPTKIPTSQLPPPLGRKVVFRAISSGGFAGRTDEILLLEDGTVRLLADRSSTSEEINRISVSELREFQDLLDEQRFYQFDRLEYKPNRGAADFITVTLSSASGTTRYADIIQDRLPESLQNVISAWNRIAKR